MCNLLYRCNPDSTHTVALWLESLVDQKGSIDHGFQRPGFLFCETKHRVPVEIQVISRSAGSLFSLNSLTCRSPIVRRIFLV